MVEGEVRRKYWQVSSALREAPGQQNFFKVESVGERRCVKYHHSGRVQRGGAEGLTRAVLTLTCS